MVLERRSNSGRRMRQNLVASCSVCVPWRENAQLHSVLTAQHCCHQLPCPNNPTNSALPGSSWHKAAHSPIMPKAYTSAAGLMRPCDSSSGAEWLMVPVCVMVRCVRPFCSTEESPKSLTLATWHARWTEESVQPHSAVRHQKHAVPNLRLPQQAQ